MVMTKQEPREPPKKRTYAVTAKPLMHEAKRFKPFERVEDVDALSLIGELQEPTGLLHDPQANVEMELLQHSGPTDNSYHSSQAEEEKKV